MARDYKHRAQPRRKSAKNNQSVAWWKWLLVIVLIAVFVLFLYFLRSAAPEPEAESSRKPVSTAKKVVKKTKAAKPEKPKSAKKPKEEPHYEFYTLLPETEVEVPDYEIKTRVREEHVGKATATRYIIQAGSFKNYADADKRRAELALMGIESHIETARIGNTVWNRVKMGPFTRSASVSTIKKRLKQNGIDVIVTEK